MNVRHIFRQNPTLANMLASGAGSLLAPLVSFASILVVAQLYDPDDYGLWAIVVSIALILGSVVTLRFESAIVLVGDEREAGTIFFLCVLVSGLFAVGSCVATWAVSSLASAWQYREGVLAWLWCLPVLVFLTGFLATATAWCTRRQSFGIRSLSMIALACVTCAVQVGAHFAGYRGAGGLILGTVAGNGLASLFLLCFIVRRSPSGFFAGFTLRGMRTLASRYRNFPLFSVPYAFVGSLRTQGTTLLFGVLAASSAVGYYAFAYRLTNFPVGLFSNGIRPVLFERAARQSDLRNLQRFVENLLYTLSVLCLPGLVLFIFRADYLFSVLLPEKWSGAAPYAQLLVIPAVAFLHTNWMDRILDVLQLQKLALQMEAFFSVASLTALGVGLLLVDDPVTATALQAACLLAYNLFSTYVIYREAGFDHRGLWRWARRAAFFTGVCVLLSWGLVAGLPLYVADSFYLVLTYGAGGVILAKLFARHLRQNKPQEETAVLRQERPQPARLSV